MLQPEIHATAPISEDVGLRRAILRTLIYADVFECPLTPSQLHRYLIGRAATAAEIAAALDDDVALRERVGLSAGWVYLAGRGHLVDLGRERERISAQLWPIAQRYGAMIARLPFVRLVAVTGALSMNNARRDDDIDLFILVQPGRLWLCRLLVLTIVKLAERRGIELCPNFLLSTDHLRLTTRNLYTAHEVVQMVPLTRGPWYQAFLEANDWVSDILPNASAKTSSTETHARAQWPARITAGLLSTPIFDPLERWEMARKVRRLTARVEREGGSVAFSAHECRGHFAAHEARVLAAYGAQLASFREALA